MFFTINEINKKKLLPINFYCQILQSVLKCCVKQQRQSQLLTQETVVSESQMCTQFYCGFQCVTDNRAVVLE